MENSVVVFCCHCCFYAYTCGRFTSIVAIYILSRAIPLSLSLSSLSPSLPQSCLLQTLIYRWGYHRDSPTHQQPRTQWPHCLAHSCSIRKHLYIYPPYPALYVEHNMWDVATHLMPYYGQTTSLCTQPVWLQTAPL